MVKLKVLELRKYLSAKENKELVDEIVGLVKLFPNVKEYYASVLNPRSEDELLKKYKKIIRNEFYPDRGFPKWRYSVAKKAISDFMKISNNPKNIADLMLVYVEAGVDCTMEYGDIDENFYWNMETMFDKAAEYISKNNLEEEFRERCKEIMERPSGKVGWGFPYELEETYNKYFSQIEFKDETERKSKK